MPKRKVKGVVKKVWLNSQLAYRFQDYIEKFGYECEYEKVTYGDLVSFSNFRDLFWLLVFYLRRLICIAYCKAVSRDEPAFYL